MTRKSADTRRREQIKKGIHPLWVLLAGARPSLVSSTRRGLLTDATHYCREGDTRWRPISELLEERHDESETDER